MKRHLNILFIFQLLPVILHAASVRVNYGDLSYTVDSDAMTAEVYGQVSYPQKINNLVIPDYIVYNGEQIPVTSIRANAFWGRNEFTGSLTIGENVQTIGVGAFNGCTGFTGSLTIPDSVQTIGDSAFKGCTGFTGSLTIGENVRTIGGQAFDGCSGFIGSLTIPDSVQTIGDYAFSGCFGFTGSLTIGNNVQIIEKYAFSECSGFAGSLTIGENVRTIGVGAFSGCSGFTGSLTIGNNVQIIEKSAFYRCFGFTGSLTIGDVVQTIGDYAFYHCTGFTGSLTIGDSVRTIGDYAFYHCTGFTGLLTIGDAVQTIGERAFYECSGFTGLLTIPDSVQTIGGYAFYGCSGFTGSLTIPDSVLTIGRSAFSECFGLTGSLTIPDSVQTIGGYAFYGCSGFTGELVIPESVVEIGSMCFAHCSNLSSLIFSSSNTKINYMAFASCDGLQSITSLGVIPPECIYSGTYDFIFPLSSYSHPLYVPAESVELYRNATEWKKFKYINPIYEEPESITLSSENLTLLVGQSYILKANIEPESDNLPAVTWSIDNEETATVDELGKVTGLRSGEAVVTATCGDVSASCKVTVIGTEEIEVRPGEGTTEGDEGAGPGANTEDGGSLIGRDLTLRVGQRAGLTLRLPEGLSVAPRFLWSVGDGGSRHVTMSVSEDSYTAYFTGESVGRTTYTVSLIGEEGDIETAGGNITVIAAVPFTSLSVEPAEVTMAQNALPVQLTAVYEPGDASEPTVVWTTSDPTVATVDESGKVTPVGQGGCVVTAESTDGSLLKATSDVRVTAPIDAGFELTYDDTVMGSLEGVTIYLGETFTLTPKAHEGYELPEGITWSSSEESIVTVEAGVVTGVGLGEAEVTASAIVNGETVTAGCKVTVIPVSAQSVTLDVEDLKLLAGTSRILEASVAPENTTFPVITWTTSDPETALVDELGKVTGLRSGEAVVTATCGDVSASCKVTVIGTEEIEVRPGEGTTEGDDGAGPGANTEDGGSLIGRDLILRVGQRAGLTLRLPEGLSVAPRFLWSVGDGGSRHVTMSVSEDSYTAYFTGESVGTTTYRVSLIGEEGEIETAQGNITVIAAVPFTSLSVEPAEVTMAQNALPVQLTAVYEPGDASEPTVVWTTSDPTVATVDESGKVTPVGQGGCVITAESTDGSLLKATSDVRVTAPIDEDFDFDESVMGGVEGLTIHVGESYTLEPKAHEGYVLPNNITWTTSNAEIVTVDEHGTVKGMALGSVTISATAVINGKEIKATCTVTVVPIKVSEIILDKTAIELEVTETYSLSVTMIPDDATDQNIQWTTNAPSIVSVDENGRVTALMVGEANITARATDGSNVYASCKVTVVPTIATGISIIAEGDTELMAEETLTLTAVVTPETTTDKKVSWKSSKVTVATVNDSGVVTAVAVGQTTVTATNSAGQSDDVTITVIPTPVAAIDLNRGSAQLKVSDSFQLLATVRPNTATDKSVKWISSKPEVASVDQEGNVVAISLGETMITCEAQDGSGVKAQCLVTVTQTATQGISITANGSTTLRSTETVQLTATVLPATSTDKSVRWQSDKPEIAQVDATGLVTAISVGEALITATNSGGQTANMTITVVPTPVESIKLSKTSATLEVTQTLALTTTISPETATDKTLLWTSDNEEVATVTQTGLVTAMAIGEANVIATAADGSGVTATCQVRVTATAVTEISLTASGSTTLKAGENVQLIARVLPETATDKTVMWSAGNPEIADVNDNGLVTAYAVGQSVITATSSSGLTAEMTITVEPTLVASITLNRTSVTLKEGNIITLIATILPVTATDKRMVWTSSDPEVATVDGQGNVVAISIGQASIICKAQDGSEISASCIVNVVATEAEILTVTAEGSTTLKVTETVQLKATIKPETATDKSVTWASSDPGIATVDAEGLVTAMSEGTATISATSNGLTDRITITVIATRIGSITLNESTITLLARESYSLIATISPSTATDKSVSWSSADPYVATVTQEGIVTGQNVGKTTVSVIANDGSGVTASCEVNVIPTVATSISITYTGGTEMNVNESLQLTAEVLPETATDKTVTWTSSNPAVADVNANGLVTAYSIGEAVITATNSAGQYDRINVTVISNETFDPELPSTPKAETPMSLLRKGDGTSCTFVTMMPISDSEMEALGYRLVYGYDSASDVSKVLENTDLRYCETTYDIYHNKSYDFWVFAYYVNEEGDLCVSSRRHLDGSVDDDFNPALLIYGDTNSRGDEFIGIFTLDGRYVGKDVKTLSPGVYLIHTSNSTVKIIK